MENPQKDQNQKPQKVVSYFLLFELGIEFAVMIGLPLGLVVFLHKKVGGFFQSKTFIIVGILVALILSFYMILKKINEVRKMIQ